jgi:hypothetical protein
VTGKSEGPGRHDENAPRLCLSCNAVEPKTLADHAPTCQFVKRKDAERSGIDRLLKRYKPKGSAGVQRVNKPGNCKLCGESVKSLLGHLRVCKGRR